MKILIVHNAYQHKGGEDSVVDAEVSLLRSRGNNVLTYFRSNDDIITMSQTSAAYQTLWSSRTVNELSEFVRLFQPDVIHAHNTFPLISPSVYSTAATLRTPVVQTLHNFRLLCLNGLFMREGKVCEDCQGKLPWRGIMRKCYRGSVPASAALAGMLTLHRAAGTYRHKVSRYIALNDFCRNKFIDGGLPGNIIVVKPNFVDFPAPPLMLRQGFLFVGRLSAEKGIQVLVDSVGLLSDVNLRVAGDGPQSDLLKDIIGIVPLGSLRGENVRQEMMKATALVVPSIWYENFPRTIVEAFACGLPVIASRIGALSGLVRDGITGLLFDPGNPRDLADKIAWAQAHVDYMAQMGRNARMQYESEFTAERNYVQLMKIYEDVIREQRDER